LSRAAHGSAPGPEFKDHGGHAIVEVYIEGGWSFADSLRDFYCLRKDGEIASLRDLIRGPQFVEQQAEPLNKECGRTTNRGVRRTREWFIAYRDEYFMPNHVITGTNSRVWDHACYDWKWVPLIEAPGTPEVEALNKFCADQRNKGLMDAGVSAEKIK